MKKLFALIALTVIVTAAHAQRNLRMGFTLSPNVSWMKSQSNTIKGNGGGLNYNWGFLSEYRITDNYSFTVDLMVSNMKGKLLLDSNQFNTFADSNRIFKNIGYNYNIRYFQIPIGIKMKTKEIGYFTYFGQFGLQTAFLYKSRVKIDADNLSFKNQEIFNNETDANQYDGKFFTDNISLLRMSIVIAGGVEYSLGGTTSLIAGIRYDNGITDITADKTKKIANNSISLQLGLLF